MTAKQESEVKEYHALDFYLADLLEQLNDEESPLLRQVTLKISKQTREGRIALACSDKQGAALLINKKIVGGGADYTPLVLDKGFVYLRRYWGYQQRLARQILSRLSFDHDRRELDRVKKRLHHYFSADNKRDEKVLNWQQIAAALALSSKFLIISGGPGTGKTTTITRILALLIEQYNENQPPRISLAAPTGKAAMRMGESIRESIAREGGKFSDTVKALLLPLEAKTLHRLLGYLPDSIDFRFNKNNHLVTDIVIIDEASMIDLAMMTKLFEAIPPHATVILLGDKDQLSSVETGSVFTDLCAVANNQYSVKRVNYLQKITPFKLRQIEKGEEKSIDDSIVCLLKSWRFKEDSGIGKLSRAVNKANSDDALAILGQEGFKDVNLFPSAALTIKQLTHPWQHYLQALDAGVSIADLFTAFNQFRILSALRKGLKGSTDLNRQLETIFSQQKQLDTKRRWYHGRPIMITKNSYRTGLFNGDIGITLLDDKGREQVWFQTNEGEKAFSPVRLPQHETAWVMTIHKSQGSEFEQVLMILPTEDTAVLTRQLIYTGITRAKSRLKIISNRSILSLGIEREAAQATQIRSVLSE